MLVAVGPEVALQAVIGASGHIPIVMLAGNFDPIERGYVTSLAQPAGNITGVMGRPLTWPESRLTSCGKCSPTAIGWLCSTTPRLLTSSPPPIKERSYSICRCRR